MVRNCEFGEFRIVSLRASWDALLLLFLLLLTSKGELNAGQWPTYRADAMRTGAIEDTVGPTLCLRWKYLPTHPPKPAWPHPSEEMPRMHSDSAYHTVISDGTVYWGSSVTNEVYAVDVERGTILWSFATEGPIRFAPTVGNKKLYVGSDDGYVYCLDGLHGKLKWKYRLGPTDEKVIGNGRLISLWPVRTGVLLDEDVVYCGAGVFPYEGIYLCALNANDGSVLWKNDTIGDRAHEIDYGGITPHGYLLASKDILYCPSGRAMPAGFDRKTGKFLFFASAGGKKGGTWALLEKNRLVAGVDHSGTPHKAAYDPQTGERRGDVFAWFPGIDIVANDAHSYLVTQQGIYAVNRRVLSEAERRVKALSTRRDNLKKQLDALTNTLKSAESAKKPGLEEKLETVSNEISRIARSEKKAKNSSYKWFYPGLGFNSAILTGEILYVGGTGRVVGLDVRTGREVWSETVEGTAVSMAAAAETLVVSSDKGPIYCFAETEATQVRILEPDLNPNPYPDDDQSELYRKTAEKIIADSGINKGYALVLQCNIGRLAYELAKRSELKIVGLESDLKKVQQARHKLKEAGLWGNRVVVEPWDIEDLPPYFANLITSDGLLTFGRATVNREQLAYVLRPYGGTIVAGSPDGSEGHKWFKFTRPGLDGATGWTQQYGNPQNTACSNDTTVKGPLGLLWYGEPGSQRMVERHAKAQSPLALNGRMFVQGEEVIMAYDAFNGSFLWQRDIPGAVRARADIDGGNLALTEDALYVAANDVCYRLDPKTGGTVREYALPEATDGLPRRWGCVFCVGDVLVGVRAFALKKPYAADFHAKYPQPADSLSWAYKRSNAKWAPMTSYPKWENYSSDVGSVTENMLAGDMVFAIDGNTGEVLWRHRSKRIANITLSIADGRVFFAESNITDGQLESALEQRSRLISNGTYSECEKMKRLGEQYRPADVRLAVALDPIQA